MVFKHGEYNLYCSEVRLRDGKKLGKTRMNYFFSMNKPKSGKPCDLPSGYKIVYNSRTKMPLLKYDGKKSTWKR